LATYKRQSRKKAALWGGFFCFALLGPLQAYNPPNSDGPWSISLGGSFSGNQEVERWTNHSIDSSSGHLLLDHGNLQLDSIWTCASRLEFPLSQQLSVGLDVLYQAANLKGGDAIYDTVAYRTDFRAISGSLVGLRIGPNLRIHFSGMNWNLPWGQGGSPWGPVFHPVLELGGLFFNDSGSDAALPIVSGPEFHGSVTLPLYSWLAASLNGATVFDPSGTSPGAAQVIPIVGQRSAYGNELGVGLKATLPIPYFHGQCDYAINANPDGRPGIPVFCWNLNRFWTANGPFSETQRYALIFPIRPSFSASLAWNSLVPTPEQNALRAAGKDSYGYAAQGTIEFGLSAYFGSLGKQTAQQLEEKAGEKQVLRESRRKILNENAGKPKNQDGFRSIELEVGFAPSQELFKASNAVNYSDSYNQDYFENQYWTSLDSALIGEIHMLFPQNPVFSIGLALALGDYQIHSAYNSLSVFNSTSPPSVTSNYSSQTNYDGFKVIRLSVPMHFHSSGFGWNEPWGSGGSPWGRVFRPSFELESILQAGHSDESTREGSWVPGIGLVTKMTEPLNSWLALSLGLDVGASYPYWGSFDPYSSGSTLPGLESDVGLGYELVLKMGLPLAFWFGPADYAQNANPDGRIGLPSFEASLRREINSYDAPSQRLQVSLAFPVKPWLSLVGTWQQINYYGLGTDLFENSQIFMFSPRFYWESNATPPKPVEAKVEKQQNQVSNPSNSSPVPEEKK
jgi:hypothetical protein